MNYNPKLHHRRSIRLKGYDYSKSGAYFITLCTKDCLCLFGKITHGIMKRNDSGNMIHKIWCEIPENYPSIEIDDAVVMPNHFHGIIHIVKPISNGALNTPQSQKRVMDSKTTTPLFTLSDLVHRFKTMTTKCYSDGVKELGWTAYPGKLWQRNYWERVIRSPSELNALRQYIQNNPVKWVLDRLYVSA